MGLDFEAESTWPRKKEKEEVPNRGRKIGRGNRVETEAGRAGLAPWASRHQPVPASHSPFHPKPTFLPPLCFLRSRLFLHPRPRAWRAMAQCDHGQVATVKPGSHFYPSLSLRIGNVTPVCDPRLSPTKTFSSPLFQPASSTGGSGYKAFNPAPQRVGGETEAERQDA